MFEQWPWSKGIAYAWGIGEFSGGELEVEGHDPVATRDQVVGFDARGRFRIQPLIGRGVVAASTVKKAWARLRPDLAELLRSVGFCPPRAGTSKDVVEFQLLESTAESARKVVHTSYKRQRVKEKQKALFPQLLKKIEEKRTARNEGSQWGGEARLGAAFRNELAKQAYPSTGGTEDEKRPFFDEVIGAYPDCF